MSAPSGCAMGCGWGCVCGRRDAGACESCEGEPAREEKRQRKAGGRARKVGWKVPRKTSGIEARLKVFFSGGGRPHTRGRSVVCNKVASGCRPRRGVGWVRKKNSRTHLRTGVRGDIKKELFREKRAPPRTMQASRRPASPATRSPPAELAGSARTAHRVCAALS